MIRWLPGVAVGRIKLVYQGGSTVRAAHPDEAALLVRLRAGDSAAFEQLVRDYGGAMLAVTRRLLSNEEDARDAFQEACLSAFRAIHTFEGHARLATWLHRIAANAALMRLRTRQRRPEKSIEALLPKFRDDGHQAEPAVEWRQSASEAAASAETRALVQASIQQLPEGYRLVLLLRDIEGFDTAETAEWLGIEPNAVKVRLHRARQALRTLLDPHFRAGRL
jgi:RNA polymerase sigma-70 factor (ECF subfamily)